MQDGGLNIGSPLTINASGKATLTDAVLSVGNHSELRRFTAAIPDFVGSTGTVRYTNSYASSHRDFANFIRQSVDRTGKIVTFISL